MNPADKEQKESDIMQLVKVMNNPRHEEDVQMLGREPGQSDSREQSEKADGS